MTEWIDTIDTVAGCEPVPASGDASFRRYFRLHKGGDSFIVMDAPPPQEDCRPFVRIAGFLESMQLNAARIIEADIDRGFLLLSDLGEVQYLHSLEAESNVADRLYGDAIEALVVMQRRGRAFQNLLPPYDEELLRFELSLFRDWLCGTHLQLKFTAADERHWQTCCDMLVDNAERQPPVFVHRDYHSRNLMLVDDNNPGIIDFQDAVEGPLTYDLVSLLKDCYISWPAGRVRSWAMQFYAKQDDTLRNLLDESLFMRQFELMGVQRQLKAAGIFCRLNHRDGKSAYLHDVPRTLQHILDVAPAYDELEFLSSLIEKQVLPAWSKNS